MARTRKTVEYLQNWPEIQYIGDQLKAVRKEMNMSQREFAEHLGISQPYISEFEKGGISPFYLQLVKIAARCGKNVSYFILERPIAEILATPEPPRGAAE